MVKQAILAHKEVVKQAFVTGIGELLLAGQQLYKQLAVGHTHTKLAKAKDRRFTDITSDHSDN